MRYCSESTRRMAVGLVMIVFYFFLQFYSTEKFVQYWDVCAVLRRLYSTETVGLALSHVNIKDLQTVYIPKPMLTWSHVRHLDLFYYADQGYTVIRIHTDNPGWWFFHCHYAFHSGNGMMLTLNEMPENKTKFDAFEPEEWQKKLQCGSWTTRKTSIIKTALGFDGKKLSVGWGGVVGGLILLYISGSRLKCFSPYSMFSDSNDPHHIDHRRTGWMKLQNKFELDDRMSVEGEPETTIVEEARSEKQEILIKIVVPVAISLGSLLLGLLFI